MSLENLSVIVPIADNDEAWTNLVPDLRLLPLRSEILLVSPRLPKDAPTIIAKELAPGRSVRWITAGPGRAQQMNAGAAVAKRPFLWFLHADSQIPSGSTLALERALAAYPGALHYFELRFLADGPRGMRWNERGAWIRSRYLGVPFGDQGFCLSKETFERLGGFPEDAPYGEDHLLVWRAHRASIPVRCTGAPLWTSARKYRQGGWWTTTRNHLQLTFEQGWPEAWKLLRDKAGRRDGTE